MTAATHDAPKGQKKGNRLSDSLEAFSDSFRSNESATNLPFCNLADRRGKAQMMKESSRAAAADT